MNIPRSASPLLCMVLLGLLGSAVWAADSHEERAAGNSATGLAQRYLTPSVELARTRAQGFASAWQQARNRPLSTRWAMPPAYGLAGAARRRPQMADPPNVWFPIGPQPISFASQPGQVWGAINAQETGRLISLAIGPQGQIFAGAEFGGVWLYTPGTGTWTPLTDGEISPQIGDIALDTSSGSTFTIYAGTGADNSLGVCGQGPFAQGILKSADGGATWTVVGGATLQGAGIGRILVRQGSLLVASSTGIYASSDGGATWTQTYAGCAFDLAYSAAFASKVYAATQGGLMVSTNGGTNWNSVGVSQPPLPGGFGSISHIALGVALSPANSTADVIYASFVGGGCTTWAPFASTDSGATWSTPGSPPSVQNGWCSIGLANTLAVDQASANIAAYGGDWLFIYNASSSSWTQVGISAVAHSDTRALTFDDSGHLFVGNDGGMWEVPDPTNPNSGSSLNGGGLQVTEFYHGFGLWDRGGTIVIAGSQDNGSEYFWLAPGPLSWTGVLGADGGSSVIDQNNVQHMFSEWLYPSPSLNETTNGGSSWSGTMPQGYQWSGYRPNGYSYTPYAPLTISPATDASPAASTALYLGGNGVYELAAPTSGASETWSALPQACTQSSCIDSWVSALTTDALNPAHVFAAWSDGTINFSTDSGATWNIANRGQLIGGTVSAITVSPADPYTLAITTDDGHVWVGSKINTAAPQWTDDTGDLRMQGLAINAAVYSAGGLIVASDLGVFEQQGPQGSAWARLGEGLPNTVITDLQWASGNLVAITYGRGAWEVSPAPTAPKPNCQLLGRYWLCDIVPVIELCATHPAVCHPVCEFPCSSPVLTWTPQTVVSSDPWVDGTLLTALAGDLSVAQKLVSGLKVTFSTQASTETLAERSTTAAISEQGVARSRDVVIVGPSLELSARSHDAISAGARARHYALRLPFAHTGSASAQLRLVRFDEARKSWVEVAGSMVDQQKRLIEARIPGDGRYTVVEVPRPR